MKCVIVELEAVNVGFLVLWLDEAVIQKLVIETCFQFLFPAPGPTKMAL